MKTSLFLTNIKCNGCTQTIKKTLSQEGIENIEIIFDANNSHIKREIRFEGDTQKVKEILSPLGYVEYDSEEAKSFLKKAKSFVSCALGKF